ncbi:MAG: aminotransferase class III-fold pyridoxal phosphate-dependent enzyme [Deltaproteobacteria bacterium]|nr:aminotransferase class III-fold pyridoxal phosphate-dependent enzyme [Deltaproteobacteria bacterium]
MNSGQQLWNKAVNVIPGGNGLLSKRPDRYAPDIWPTYFSKAKGVNIWDLDGNRYIDMSYMGIGTAILGYSDNDVDNAVKLAIDEGVNTTLNAPEEFYLAEKLLELNPFAGSVKFARSGAEAMTIAIRIARAYTGKCKVAFSGYHGWSDWYLAANLAGIDNLEGHLLPGLPPKGVPNELINTSMPFEYNNINELKALIMKNPDVGVIVIEGARHNLPSLEFLNEIALIASEKNIVVIVDEITSGWRITDGGVYKTTGFVPDIVVYGKALGNGFAISATVGKKTIMDVAQDTFISSTFWTERVGFVAALATIQKTTENKVWNHLIDIGTKIGKGWKILAEKHNIRIEISEFKPLITMKFKYGEQNASIETLFTQEMLKRGYLATTSVYASYAHTVEIIEEYLANVSKVFEIISQAIHNDTVSKMLETRIKEGGFKRLT